MTRTEITYTDKNALDTDYNFYWVFPYYELENGKKVQGKLASTNMQRELFRQWEV